MNQTDRRRLLAWVALDSALGLGWAGFALGIVPPMLTAEHPGPAIEALKRYLHVPPVAFLNQDLLGRWREFTGAVLIAMALHLTIVVILGRSDRASAEGGSPREARASRRMGLIQAAIAMAFLAVAVLAPQRQDYFFYLEMWYHVRQGDDPWFVVWGMNGKAPLNAYGPLFNPLAYLAWINPAAPRLLFSYVYLLFAIAMSRGFAAGRPPSAIRTAGLLALLWNPFVWVEIPFYGHFDLLVGLACLGAVRAWAGGRDVRAGLALAAGVLLKYLPIVLVPFLALDRDANRPRARFLIVAIGVIALGLGFSCLVWGPTTFLPLSLAASRYATTLSIFHFLHGRYSPLIRLGIPGRYQELSMPAMALALWGTWWWSRTRKPEIEASALVAVLSVVLLYRVGYPQYQMVPFVMAAAWLLGRWDRLRARALPALAMTLYFGWLSAFDAIYMLSEAWSLNVGWDRVDEWAGLPTFLLGSALVASVIRAATPPRPRPES